jgi:hypothetical protein
MKTATPTQSTLLQETKVESTCGCGDCTVRTLRQPSGEYMTVAYVPPGVDNDPIVTRYDDSQWPWSKVHASMVDQCCKWVKGRAVTD